MCMFCFLRIPRSIRPPWSTISKPYPRASCARNIGTGCAASIRSQSYGTGPITSEPWEPLRLKRFAGISRTKAWTNGIRSGGKHKSPLRGLAANPSLAAPSLGNARLKAVQQGLSVLPDQGRSRSLCPCHSRSAGGFGSRRRIRRRRRPSMSRAARSRCVSMGFVCLCLGLGGFKHVIDVFFDLESRCFIQGMEFPERVAVAGAP